MVGRRWWISCLVFCACGGSGPGKPVPETWSGTLTGTALDPNPLGQGSGAKFVENDTFSLTFPSSVVAALQLPANPAAKISSGTGSFSGTETVGGEPDDTDYMLHGSSVSDVPLTVDNASPIASLNNGEPQPEIQFESAAGQTLILSHVTSALSGDYTSPATVIFLEPNSIAKKLISGNWSANGGDNTAEGSFTMTKE